MIDPVSATGVVIAALALAHQVLKSPDVSKADKKKIENEAEKLVKLAQMSDIDAEVRKRSGGATKTGVAYKKAAAKKVAVKRAVTKTVVKKAPKTMR
jgi:hypothetical protein